MESHLPPSSLAFTAPPPAAPPSSSPPQSADPLLAHYTALITRLLDHYIPLDSVYTNRLFDGNEPGHGEGWRGIRQDMIKTLESPAACEQRTKRTVGNPSVELEGKIQLARMRKIGAKELARGCLEEERRQLSTEGGEGEVTGGMVELREWMRALRALTTAVYPDPEPPLSDLRTQLDAPVGVASPAAATNVTPNGASSIPHSAPPSSLSFNNPPFTLDPASLGLPAYTGESSYASTSHHMLQNGGFAPAPARGAMPAKKKARPSHVAASTLASSSSAGRAAEYAARTTENVESAASTSYTPYPVPSASSAGPPSLAAINAAAAASAPAPSPSPASLPGPSLSSSFAPPAPKARKPRTSSSASKPPRRTADGVLKGRGTSEVYVPPPVQPRTGDSSRPQRKRKLPTHLTFEQSSDPVDEEYEEENELATKKAKGKGKGKAKALPPPPPIDPEEIDELASDYEEELERRSSMSIDRGSATPAASVQEEEEDGRFPIGTAVMAKFPNYSFFPAIVLDPRSAPPTTQGKRLKGSYLVKSIPTGADHRWVPAEEEHIRPITEEERAEILADNYKTKPAKSWIVWRDEMVEAMLLSKDPEALKDWASRPTDLEFRIAAERERKKAEKATESMGW